MFGVRLSKMGSASKLGLIAKAIGILRKYGTDAHVYLPGIGTVSGLTAGNYLDSAGVTAASVDNPVGLSLDALQAMTLGGELVTNGDFASGATGWTLGPGWSVSAGAAVVNTGGGNGSVYQAPSVNLKTYQITFTITSYTSGSLYAVAHTTLGPYVTATGTYSQTVVANGTGGFGVYAVSGTIATVDNISVREIPGIHTTQGTTANKPILRRGLLNLLRQSQALATTPWAARVGTIVATNNFAVGLDGTTTATKLDKTGAVDAAWQQGTDTVMSASTPYTAVFIFQKSVTTKIAEVAIRTVLGGIDYSSYVSFDTLSGATYVRVDTGTPAVTVSVADASTYWVIALNKTSASGASADSNIIIRPYIGTTLGGFDDTATGSCVVWRAGLFPGTYTAQQILDAGGIPLTTSAAASSTTGKYWWQFDGSNDSLLTGNLGITNTVSVVIAGRLNSLATVQTLFAEDANGVQIYIDTSGIVTLVKFGVSLIVNTAAATIVAGVPFVVTVRLSGGTAVIRKNGVQVVTAATALAFSATTGARIGTNFDGTTQPAGGAIGWVVPLPAALSDADCLTVERLVAAQFPGLTTPDGDALALLLEDGSGFLTMETGDLLLLE